MEVKVNVINEMKKLRNSTYSDRLSWVDELIQNAQRSKASHIKVTVEYDKVVVQDNGVGCTDPQVLFDKSSSGWDEETNQTQNPFGEGFFSTMMVADKIKVSSVGFDAVFDVKKMFESESTECISIKKNTRKSGFVVVLTDLREEYSMWGTKRRFKEVGRYIQSPTMSLNGERVKYEGLNPQTESPFVKKVNTDWYRGWIQPFKWGRDGYDDSLKTFAFSRFVKKLDSTYGVIGVLNMVDGKVGLRSPDRRDFIDDDRYEQFRVALADDIKKMFLNIIKTGTDSDIKDYADIASRYLKLEDYKKLIRLKYLADESLQPEDLTEEEIEYIELDERVTRDRAIREVEDAQIAVKENMTKESGITPKDIRDWKRAEKQSGVLAKDMGFGFYVETEEIENYSDEIQLARLYKIPVVEVRNCLEREVVHSDKKFTHISELGTMVKLRVEYSNIKPESEAEERAYKILRMVGKTIAGREDMFLIADVNSYRVLALNGKDEKIEDVDAFAVASGREIYVNRRYMTGYQNLKDSGPDITEEDKRFVLLNIDTIAHEMSHVMYGTIDNTKEHFESIGKLVQRIINALYGEGVSV